MDRRSALKKTGWLLGSGMIVSSSGLLMESCIAKVKEETVGTKLLSNVEVEIILGMVNHMIPDTKLPENVSLAIPFYLDLTLTEYVDKETRETFEQGFQQFQRACNDQYGTAFLDCTKEQQLEFLKKQELDFIESQQPTFFGMAKQWIFEAFFQTEFGITNYLVYDPIPGGYLGCIPTAQIGGIQHSNDVFKL